MSRQCKGLHTRSHKCTFIFLSPITTALFIYIYIYKIYIILFCFKTNRSTKLRRFPMHLGHTAGWSYTCYQCNHGFIMRGAILYVLSLYMPRHCQRISSLVRLLSLTSPSAGPWPLSGPLRLCQVRRAVIWHSLYFTASSASYWGLIMGNQERDREWTKCLLDLLQVASSRLCLFICVKKE